jgi:hypothetical protein
MLKEFGFVPTYLFTKEPAQPAWEIGWAGKKGSRTLPKGAPEAVVIVLATGDSHEGTKGTVLTAHVTWRTETQESAGVHSHSSQVESLGHWNPLVSLLSGLDGLLKGQKQAAN